jgi:predicted permease
MSRRSRAFALALRVVPLRWRGEVRHDLLEEAHRGRHGAGWLSRQAVLVAFRLRRRAFAQRLPALRGVFTGFASGDLRAAVRHLRRTPLQTAVAALTLATAMAAVTAVFAVLNGTVLSPLPFPEASRLIAVWQVDRTSPDNWRNASAANFADWRREARSFTFFAAGRNTSHTLSGFDDGETPLTRRVSHGWFEATGVALELGRTFTTAETVPNGPAVAILSHDTWQRRYGGDRAVVGRAIELDGVPHEIVGVLPAGYDVAVFGLLDSPAVWLPLGVAAAGEDRRTTNHLVIGRLAPGVALDEARAELERISAAIAAAHPDTNRDTTALVTPLAESLVRPVRTPMLLMFGAVLAVFLAACGNVGHVMLARALARRQAWAMQLALGASRLRVVLQVVAEGLMVSAAAGIAAFIVAGPAARAALALVPQGFLSPRFDLTLNVTTLAAAAVAAMVAGLLASAPAIVVAARRLEAADVAAGASRAVGGRDRRRWAVALVGGEMAVAAVLLAGAGLVAAGFARLQSAPTGFDADGALTFRVSTRGPAYARREDRVRFFERVLEEFAALPGVAAAGATTALPVFPQFSEQPAYPADAPPADPRRALRLTVSSITPGFLAAMGMPLLSGRDVTVDDRADAPAIAVVSRSAARRLFGAADPIGRSIVLAGSSRPRTVTGLVGDVRSMQDATRVTDMIYVPWHQVEPPPALGFVVRSSLPDAEALALAAAAVRRIDRSMPLYLPRTMREIAFALDARGRFAAVLLSAFALVGLALVATGIYGTMSHLVAERRREIGVRVALGASRAGVLRLVLRDSLGPAVAGLSLGLVAAGAFGQVAAGALPGTPAFSWPLFLGLPAVLIAVVVIASLGPALRASRADATVVMRS